MFHIKESDLAEFRRFAKKNVLFSVIKDKRRTDGMVDLVTNVDFVSQVNLFMERRDYGAPAREDAAPPKAAPRAQPGSSSLQRGSGSTPSQSERRTTTRTTDAPAAKIGDIPTVKGRLAVLRAASEGMKEPVKSPKRQPGKQLSKTR